MMASPGEHSGVEAVVVRTLVELACAVVRRGGMTPGEDYCHPPPATLAAPQLTALLQALATLARVGPAWRDAFDVAWLSRALVHALSRDPPAWRGWTRGLTSAAADSPPLSLTPQQISHLLGEGDSFFSAATAGAGDTLMSGPPLDLAEHGGMLRPTIVFQWPLDLRPDPWHVVWPPPPQPASAVPPTRVGHWPQWQGLALVHFSAQRMRPYAT